MKKFTYPDLVRRLYDLEQLAQPPLANEKAGCQSSTDRSSRYDAETGQYIDWNANRDGSGYIRKEGDSIVAFEAEGPGVIWRVWSALPQMGHIQIFIDGAEKAAVDLPFIHFFEKFGNERPPMNFPELTPTLSRGRNRFIPIPYNKSCKVLLAPDWGAYYHFTYTTFPTGTELPHFDGTFDRDSAIGLAEADRYLYLRGRHSQEDNDTTVDTFDITVAPNEAAQVCKLLGNRAITSLRVRLDLPAAPATQDMLRELALSIKWDGETNPSVWSPLGDFFGTAPGVNLYRSLPLGMTEGGFYSNWFMPFAESGLIELTNEGSEARRVVFEVTHKPLAQSANGLLRFHAKWHRDAFVELSMGNGRSIDWPILNVKGNGRFCGVALHVWNRWAEPEKTADSWWYGVWQNKSIDWWWGEGDEKFFVDGEKFPSSFGTGSEDYIGYAWAAEPPFPMFESAFACQPYIELDANGHSSVNRFHIADNVPFNSSFEGCIEKYKPNHWGDGNHCLYDAVAYWYQQPNQTDPYEPIPLAERVGYYAEPRNTL
ncbi:MAG: glycoside hydrolase family 172 protein [Chloroflexota bacterium]